MTIQKSDVVALTEEFNQCWTGMDSPTSLSVASSAN